MIRESLEQGCESNPRRAHPRRGPGGKEGWVAGLGEEAKLLRDGALWNSADHSSYQSVRFICGICPGKTKLRLPGLKSKTHK